MIELLLTAVAAATVSNAALAYLVGLQPLATTPGEDARPVAVATGVALVLAAGPAQALHGILAASGWSFLQLPALLAIAMLTVRLGRRAAGRGGDAVPFVATTGVVLAVLLLIAGPAPGLLAALLLGAGTALGYGAVLFAFAAARPRLERDTVPVPFRGPAITLVTFGILSLAFLGFAGLGS